MSSRTLVAAGVAAVTICGIAVLVYVLADTGESAGAEEGVTLNDVVENPRRFEGARVTISGEWAENDHFSPQNAEEVIVLGDDAGTKLLVIPKLGVEVPEVDENTALKISGDVRIPDRTDAGYVDTGGLLRSDEGPAPVIAADGVDLVAQPEDPIVLEPDEVTVQHLLRDPETYDERPVVVRGVASSVGGRGFVLTQQDASIFVSAPRSTLNALENGERVRVRADLSTLSSYGAEALENAISTDPPGNQPPSETGFERLPIEVGDPYLLLRSLEGDAA